MVLVNREAAQCYNAEGIGQLDEGIKQILVQLVTVIFGQLLLCFQHMPFIAAYTASCGCSPENYG